MSSTTDIESVKKSKRSSVSTIYSDEKTPLVNQVIEDAYEDEEKPALPLWKLITLTITFFGIQIGWALQIAFASPLLEELGVPEAYVNWAWLAGPISGLIVQPTIGILSDNTTSRLGRRRPYLIGGVTFIIIGEILVSNAQNFGLMLGDPPKNTDHPVLQIKGVIFAVVGIWILDLSNNLVQGPLRVLLVDIAPPDQQNLGGSLFSGMIGLGNLVGWTIGYFKWKNYMPFLQSSYQFCFSFAMVVLVLTIALTCMTIHEKPLQKHERKSTGNPFVEICKGIYRMPNAMWRICAVQFFSWFGWFCVLVYATQWVGTYIFHGDAKALDGSEKFKNFRDGVEWGSLSMAAEAIISALTALMIPLAVRFTSIKMTYAFAQLWLAGALITPLFISERWGAFGFIVSLGLPWATTMALPFTLVALNTNAGETGLYMGVLNIFVVIPQLIVAIGFGVIVEHFGIKPVFCIGAVASVISSILCFFLHVPKLDNAPTNFVMGGGH